MNILKTTAPTGHHDAFEQAGANAGAEALKLGVNILKTTITVLI